MAKPRRTSSDRAPKHAPGRADGVHAEVAPRQSITGPVIGAIFALCAFSVAVLAGLSSGNSATSVVGRALLAMIVCYPIGLVAGCICQHVLREHLRAHADAHPVPDLAEQHDETMPAPEQPHDAADAEEPLLV
jgi:hypothetical protein